MPKTRAAELRLATSDGEAGEIAEELATQTEARPIPR
jgi:hypothetical protein